MYWERGDERRIYFAVRHWLYALDARTGKPLAGFGQERPHRPAPGLPRPRSAHAQHRREHAGRVLRRPAHPRLRRARGAARRRRATSAPSTSTPAGSGGPSTRSRTRASSATTPGRRTPGATPAAPTPGPGLALDERRGLVFAATGSAAYDFYGGNRHGDNLFANTILCLRAATGERVWHFQAVKHDVWDRDFPAPRRPRHHREDGRAAGRRGPDREERPDLRARPRDGRARLPDGGDRRRPPRTSPGEQRGARHRCCPTLPPPFTRQRFTEDLITTRTPEARARRAREVAEACARAASSIRPAPRARSCSRAWTAAANGAAPPSTRRTGLLYVNANEMAWTVRLKERPMPDGEPQTGKALYARYCASCHRADLRGTPPEFPSLVDIATRRSVDEIAAVVRDGAGRMPGLRAICTPRCAARIVEYVVSGRSITVRQDAPTPFDVRYTLDGDVRFTDPDGFPAITPPWGTLDRHRHEQGGHRLAGAARRDAGGGPRGHGLRELRRPGGHGQRAASSSARRSTTRRSAPSTPAPARCCGRRSCPRPATRRPPSTRWAASSSW